MKEFLLFQVFSSKTTRFWRTPLSSVLRQSYVCPTAVLRQSLASITSVLRQSYVSPTPVLHLSYVSLMSVLRQSYDCPTQVLRLLF